jgi:hypothetical protein
MLRKAIWESHPRPAFLFAQFRIHQIAFSVRWDCLPAMALVYKIGGVGCLLRRLEAAVPATSASAANSAIIVSGLLTDFICSSIGSSLTVIDSERLLFPLAPPYAALQVRTGASLSRL